MARIGTYQTVTLRDVVFAVKEHLAEGKFAYVDDAQFAEWVQRALLELYPVLHKIITFEQHFTTQHSRGDTIQLPKLVRRVCDVIVKADALNQLTDDMLITAYDVVPSIESSDAFMLRMDYDTPLGTMIITAESILAFDTVDQAGDQSVIQVPSMEPIILHVAARFFTVQKNESLKNRDRESYALYTDAVARTENALAVARSKFAMQRPPVRVKADQKHRRNVGLAAMNAAQTLWC